MVRTVGVCTGLGVPKLTAAISKPPQVLDAPRAELSRLCRSILIRYARDGTTAGRETDFLGALADVRARFGDDTPPEAELWEVVVEEEKRVADAAVVAELLLPRLSELLRERPTRTAPIPERESVPPPPPATETVRSQTLRTEVSTTPARAQPPGIADLLEGMLDQERADIRNRTPPRRS